MKKLFKLLLIAVAVFMILPSVVSAATPYATYTYSAGGQVLTSPAAYVPDTVVDAAYMGLNGTIDDPRDLLVGPDERVYIVDAASASVKVLDRYYKFLFEIKSFTNEHGVPDTFLNPSGVFVNDKYNCLDDLVIFKYK